MAGDRRRGARPATHVPQGLVHVLVLAGHLAQLVLLVPHRRPELGHVRAQAVHGRALAGVKPDS